MQKYKHLLTSVRSSPLVYSFCHSAHQHIHYIPHVYIQTITLLLFTLL